MVVCRILGEGKNARLGRCYELAGQYVSSHPSATLVHGRLTNPFGKGLAELDHAWVVEGTKVFDPVMDQWWDASVYEGLFKAKVQASYSHQEVLAQSLKHEHWGPWA